MGDDLVGRHPGYEARVRLRNTSPLTQVHSHGAVGHCVMFCGGVPDYVCLLPANQILCMEWHECGCVQPVPCPVQR